jgi:environmental stress-induced protein Ves
MSFLHRIALAGCPPRPWRNGGGVTRELLAWPRPDHWQLRVSVAAIEQDGPFSPFPGVQRWFAVLAGAGVRLDLARGAVTLAPHDVPIAFEGEDAPWCHLLEGATQDLNFMVQRGSGVAALRVAAAGGALEGDLRFRALYAVEPAQLDIDDRTEPVGAATLVWSDERDSSLWTLRQGRHAYWLTLEDA